MLPTAAAREIAGLRFRLGSILVMRQWLRFAFIWVMVWATGTVALRAVFRADRWMLLWGLAGLPVAAAVGAVVAWRKMPSAEALRARLDRHGRLGGLLMAAGDTEIGAWHQRIAELSRPTLRWHWGRPLMFLALATTFLLAALLAPDRSFPSIDQPTLEIGGQIEGLAEQLEVLKQEDILPTEKAETLEETLQQVQRDALGKDPAKTLETMDHLAHSFRKAANEAAESVIRETETASHLQELSAALQAAEGEMEPARFEDAMNELAQMAEEALSENEMLATELSDELRAACQSSDLTHQQLESLREALGECQACQQARLERLVEARLVDAGKLALRDQAAEHDPEALAAALCEGNSSAAALAGSLPGRGGISRGRGDAAMTWQDEVAQGDAAFQEKVLPSSAVGSLKKSQLTGLSAGVPTESGPDGRSSGRALQSAPAGGGEAHAQRILPEHAKTVQRYFDRGKP